MIPVPQIKDVDLAFGNTDHLPPMSKIPAKFKEDRNTPQVRFVSLWFFKGLTEEDLAKLIPKPGVVKTQAIDAIRAILVSYQPKHEHKTAGTAFLLSEWFEELK